MTDNCKLIDTHAHLDFDSYQDDLDAIILNARLIGVEKIIVPGVTIKDIPKIIELIDKYDNLYGAVSQHPSEVKDWTENSYNELKEYARHPKIIAIGETGLDYYWDKSNVEMQKFVFKEHIKLSKELKLPLIIHNRDAHADTLGILKEMGADEVGGVMHCFSGSAEFAIECIKFGFYIALGGPITFKNAKKPKEVAQVVPLEKLLLETDSPFLTPHPFRGSRNDPGKLKLIADEIAIIKNMATEEVICKTTCNAEKLFKF